MTTTMIMWAEKHYYQYIRMNGACVLRRRSYGWVRPG